MEHTIRGPARHDDESGSVCAVRALGEVERTAFKGVVDHGDVVALTKVRLELKWGAVSGFIIEADECAEIGSVGAGALVDLALDDESDPLARLGDAVRRCGGAEGEKADLVAGKHEASGLFDGAP